MVTKEAVIEYLNGKTDHEVQEIVVAAAETRCFSETMIVSSIDFYVAWCNSKSGGGLIMRHCDNDDGPSLEDCGAYWWARRLRSTRLHLDTLIEHLLCRAQRDGRFDLSRLPRETSKNHFLRLCCELQDVIMELQIDFSRHRHGYSALPVGAAREMSIVFERGVPENRRILSLLDVAVLTGDAKLSRFLASLHVPQLLAYKSDDFINLNTGLIQERNVPVIEAAACAGIHLRNDVSYSAWDPLPWNLLERAIAGKTKKAVDILRRYGFTPGWQFGSLFMRVAPTQGWVRRMRFFIDKDRVQLAVRAGIALPSIRVNPWHALWYACMTCRSTCQYTAFEKIFLLNRNAWWRSQEKWRPGQTLLEIAINCGQREMIQPLIDLKIEAVSLTSEELHSYFLVEEDTRNQGLGVSINEGCSSLEAAQVAFQKSRFQYQLLIMQMTSWWHRFPVDTNVRVAVHHRELIDVISNFAAALPKLPEFDALTPSAAIKVDEVRHDMHDQLQTQLPDQHPSSNYVHDYEERHVSTHPTAENAHKGDADESQGGGDVQKEEEEEAMAMESSIVTAHEEEASHLSEALLHSKADAMALSGDDVVITRLTGRTTRIAEVLRESPHLTDCRARVTEAQCDIFPAWANGACLLVPLTYNQLMEAEIELHAHNIVSLCSDLESIRLALSVLSNRQRPKLRPEHHAHNPGSPAHGMSSGSGLDVVETPEHDHPESAVPCDVDLVVENTFFHFKLNQLSEASTVVYSAPAGSGNSPQPKNPRRWNRVV